MSEPEGHHIKLANTNVRQCHCLTFRIVDTLSENAYLSASVTRFQRIAS